MSFAGVKIAQHVLPVKISGAGPAVFCPGQALQKNWDRSIVRKGCFNICQGISAFIIFHLVLGQVNPAGDQISAGHGIQKGLGRIIFFFQVLFLLFQIINVGVHRIQIVLVFQGQTRVVDTDPDITAVTGADTVNGPVRFKISRVGDKMPAQFFPVVGMYGGKPVPAVKSLNIFLGTAF